MSAIWDWSIGRALLELLVRDQAFRQGGRRHDNSTLRNRNWPYTFDRGAAVGPPLRAAAPELVVQFAAKRLPPWGESYSRCGTTAVKLAQGQSTTPRQVRPPPLSRFGAATSPWRGPWTRPGSGARDGYSA